MLPKLLLAKWLDYSYVAMMKNSSSINLAGTFHFNIDAKAQA